MATLDTTRLIQPAFTPPPTTTLQPKPAEGFQRLLDDETTKVSSAAPPKPVAAASQPAREASQPVAKRPSSKARFEQDSADASKPEKAQAVAGAPRTDAPAKSVQRKSAVRESKPEATDGSAELEAESATRQNLPTETAQENSEVSEVTPHAEAVKMAKVEDPAALAQSASTAALLASLLVQTTGDLKGTEVAMEVQPKASDVSVTTECPASPAIAPIATRSTDTAPWMSSATPISPDILGGAAISENSAVPSTDPAAAIQGAAPTPELALSLNPASATPTTVKEFVAESLASDAAVPQGASVLATGQSGSTTQVDPAFQNAIPVEAAPAGPVAAAGQPAVLETPKKPGKSPIEVAEKEALPERELNPELLTSPSLSQQGADNAAGDTAHNDASASNRQDARPEGAEIVRSLKFGLTTGKETQVQPAVHEVQESNSNGTHHVPEFASSIEKQSATANTPSETGFTPAGATETASPILSGPATLGTPAIGEPTAKVAGASHSNDNWNQVEKAQVVSQIVERAHLMGKNHSEVMVVLKPEFLGKVNLHAAMVDNQLVATIMAESASVKQMLEGQLSSLQTALHEQGLPVAKVEVVQGSQLSFADLGAGQSSSQQHLESGKSQLPPSFSRYETREESAEAVPLEAQIHAPPTSRSLNLVA